MKDRTHDISLIDYHVKDVETLGKVLNNAAAAAFPRTTSSHYCDVYVLLLSWEDDDLGVVSEIDDLGAVFRDIYGYRVGKWKIPSTTSHNALVYQIMQSLRDFESSDKLFITYYGGHGYMNDDRQCVWLSIQTMLEEAECDVLILLDCCAAASSGGNHGKGVTEVIAACGFEAFAPGVGEHSFTRSLIEELKYLSQRCDAITTALLHNKVLARIKKSWNPRYSSNGTQERRRTPIHIHLSDGKRQRCIKLAPLQPMTAPNPIPLPLEGSSGQSSGSEDVDMIGSEETSQSSLNEVWPDKEFQSPKVLISVALQEDQQLNAEDWLDWLKAVPALAKFVHVVGVFKSDSTLLILSLPVALWDSMQKDPAISFLAFVRSYNLLDKCASYSTIADWTDPFHGILKPLGWPYKDNNISDSLPPATRAIINGPAPWRNNHGIPTYFSESSRMKSGMSEQSHSSNDSADSVNTGIHTNNTSLDLDLSHWPSPPPPAFMNLPPLPSPISSQSASAEASRQFARSYDLDRHMKSHFPDSAGKLDCPYGAKGSFCGRVGEKGFTRKDHRDEHLRKVHKVDLPKSAWGRRETGYLDPLYGRPGKQKPSTSNSTPTLDAPVDARDNQESGVARPVSSSSRPVPTEPHSFPSVPTKPEVSRPVA
ncbi:MAG: hypothetical protein Q9213_000539 [Squamulea squamosa]